MCTGRKILLELRKEEIDLYIIQELINLLNKLEGSLVATKLKQDLLPKVTNCPAVLLSYFFLFGFVMKQQINKTTELKRDLLPKVTNCPALIFPYFFFFGFWIMKQQMSNSTKLLKDLLPKVTEFEATYVAMQWWKNLIHNFLILDVFFSEFQ